MIINILLVLLGVVLGVGGTLGSFKGNIWLTNWQNKRATIRRWRKNLGDVQHTKPVGRFADQNLKVKPRILTRGEDKAWNK